MEDNQEVLKNPRRLKGKSRTDSIGVDNRETGRRKFVKAMIPFLVRLLLKLDISGEQNIPASGGLIIATNHMSRIDTGILLLNPVRNDMAALVADKYKKHAFINFLVESMPHIWIDRSRADFSAFNAAVDYLKQGGTLGIAPEGTRSKVQSLIEGKSGTAMIAMRAGVPIVPVGITGSEAFRSGWGKLQRSPIAASYGPAFHLPPMGEESRSEYMQRCTDEIMCRIALQLPEKYHGVYASHPRLKELQAQQLEQGG